MDPLLDMFKVVRAESVCYGRLNGTAPWGFRVQPVKHAVFGLVSEGICWLRVEGRMALLAPGDFFLVAPGREFSLSSEPGAAVREFDEDLRIKFRLAEPFGGGGEASVVVCGKFVFSDAHSQAIADLLPPLVHLPADVAEKSGLARTLDLLADESRDESSVSNLVMNRLADVLFLQAIRTYIDSAQQEKTAWVQALGDPQIGASLRSMHGSIKRPWTVAMLAADVGMSRSSYAQKFKMLLGEGPLEYLTRWRMYRAAELLVQSRNKLVDVAQEVGYDSDSAFQRVFKRIHAASPGEYRRRNHIRHTPRAAAAASGMQH